MQHGSMAQAGKKEKPRRRSRPAGTRSPLAAAARPAARRAAGVHQRLGQQNPRIPLHNNNMRVLLCLALVGVYSANAVVTKDEIFAECEEMCATSIQEGGLKHVDIQ